MDNPDRRRFTPYGAYHARQNMYQSAEAGPSNRQPHPASYDTSLTAQPPGWISETTANAEQNQTFTEEDGTPVSDFYCSPIPHVTDRLFGIRRPGRDALQAKGWHDPTARGITKT